MIRTLSFNMQNIELLRLMKRLFLFIEDRGCLAMNLRILQRSHFLERETQAPLLVDQSI